MKDSQYIRELSVAFDRTQRKDVVENLNRIADVLEQYELEFETGLEQILNGIAGKEKAE